MKLFKEAVPFKRRMQLHCPQDTYTKLLNRLLRPCMPDLPPDSQNPSSLISSPYRARATATFLLPGQQPQVILLLLFQAFCSIHSISCWLYLQNAP